MKLKQINLIKNKSELSRDEMKNIMAGSGNGNENYCYMYCCDNEGNCSAEVKTETTCSSNGGHSWCQDNVTATCASGYYKAALCK